ncbi:MAG: methionyl aminopeptidase [Lachnospiraceae bacterium]|nr:methionyl aminopeptidase [Lachnospiraceae bacterium]
MKLGRNDPCWCGSGKKYKTCHMQLDEKILMYQHKGSKVPTHKMIKTAEQIEGIRVAGEMNTKVLDYISPFVKEGISTGELDKLIYDYTIELGCIPACLGYEGYPKSVCTSIDEVVCHGIPDDNRILKSGEIINIDCTTIWNGYYGDASRMFCIGEVSPEKKKLVEVTKECLDIGYDLVKPWTHLGDIGYAVNKHAVENGYTVVREIGGHGVGVEFHEEPWVSHIGTPGKDYLLVPGMIFTIEPMVNMGKADVWQDDEDGWTVRTEDGLPSAQWEYTILVTETGAEILSR